MVTLPTSIETYLQEAGFTPTEILILKRLLEGQTLTLRELASKTGKSTGVLDQATKKLIERKIVTRENINDTSKYAISSLDAINTWMAKDMAQRHAVLERKRQDFEAFISTVQHESARPEMEFFEGMAGIQQAFTKLLTMEEREWILFTPSTMREEDDPLLEFRVDLFRQRRRKKIFMRVISPNVPLGRRYQSRDVYEYRETKLVEPEDFPVSFEQLIVGNTVACIDVSEQKASFIHYPELASGQKKVFNMLWCRAGKEGAEEECAVCSADIKPGEADLETQVLSGLREFIMSKKSIVTFGVLGLVAAGLTGMLYMNNARLNVERMRDKVLAIASTGTPIFNPDDIQLLRTEADMQTDAYKRVVKALDTIRKDNDGVKYVYIIRPTDVENMYEFVADSYGLDIGKGIDFNNDGILGEEDEIPIPGMPYDVSEIPGAFEGMKHSFAEREPFEDKWGTFISGFAPIRDEEGNAVAVLGVDKLAEDVQVMTLGSFKPFWLFLGLFMLFVAIRLAAFHKSLLQHILALSRTKKVLITLLSCACIALLVTAGMYKYTLELMKDEMGQRLMSIAATAAPEIDAKDLEKLRKAEDMKRPEYQKVFDKLNDIRDRNKDIAYVYIFRPTKMGSSVWEFVADADTIPETENEFDASPTGLQYELLPFSPQMHIYGLERPTYEQDFIHDQWGVFLSGGAPIIDRQGNTAAVLGIDIEISNVYSILNMKFKTYIWFLAIFGFLLLTRLILLICRS